MARYRKERRARLRAERISRKRDKAWLKKIRRAARRDVLPPTVERHTFLGRLVAWLLGGD